MMRAYLVKIPPHLRLFLAVPVLAVAYPVMMFLIPAIVRALVPQVVRSLLSLM
jgi:hypothetical protein